MRTMIGKIANVHEKTVQAAASGGPLPKRKPKVKKAVKELKPISISKLHPAAWQRALELADGDKQRIVALSPTECLVR